MMKDWLDASLFYVSNEPGFRVNTNPRRTYTISLSSSMMYIRQIQIFAPMQILVQAQICMGAKICIWLIVCTKKNHTQHVVLNSRATDGTRTRDLHLGKVAYYQLYYYRIHYLLFIRTINTIQYIYQLVKYIFNFICRTFLLVFTYYSVKIIFCLINRKLIESPQKVEQNFFIFSLTIPSLYGIVDIVLMNTI